MREDREYTGLLADARAGKQDSLGALAVLVSQQLYPFVFRTTLDRDATEDILQETLLAMVSRLAGLAVRGEGASQGCDGAENFRTSGHR